MCTVSIIPLTGSRSSAAGVRGGRQGIRAACNRDELRVRPAALKPVIRAFGARRAITPVDPVSDGTWIAVNDAGLGAALLNVNPGGCSSSTRNAAWISRGTLIPRVLSAATMNGAERACRAIDPQRHAPFQMIVFNVRTLIHVYSDGSAVRHSRSTPGQSAILFTSSGLGDDLVDPPRRDLFEQMFQSESDWTRVQDAFHRHSWPERRHVSVCMDRDEASTVSHTVLEISTGRVTLTYTPGAPDRTQPISPLSIPRVTVP